jgi:hypothetical protein
MTLLKPPNHNWAGVAYDAGSTCALTNRLLRLPSTTPSSLGRTSSTTINSQALKFIFKRDSQFQQCLTEHRPPDLRGV